jgi:hypothetical protein
MVDVSLARVIPTVRIMTDLHPWELTPSAATDVVLILTNVRRTRGIMPIVLPTLDRLTVKPIRLATLAEPMLIVVFWMVVSSPDNPVATLPLVFADLAKSMLIAPPAFLTAVRMVPVTIADFPEIPADPKMVERSLTNLTAIVETVFASTSVPVMPTVLLLIVLLTATKIRVAV